jgi:hypothetical protein
MKRSERIWALAELGARCVYERTRKGRRHRPLFELHWIQVTDSVSLVESARTAAQTTLTNH